MNQVQINEFRRRAKQAGKTDSEIDTFIQLKMNQVEAQSSQSGLTSGHLEEPKKDGFFKSVAKGIASPFLKLGATADALGTSKILGGKGTDNSVKQTPLGAVKPITTAREAAGVGLELAANTIGGGGVIGVGKGIAKGAVGQALKTGVKQGIKSGILAGAGTGLQQDEATFGSVVKDAAIGGAAGGVLGGALAAIPGIGIGVYRTAKGVKNFVSPESTIALTKAIKPSANNTKFVPALKFVLPDIQETAELTGSQITNLDSLLIAITTTKQRIWKTYESLLQPNQTAEIDGNEIADLIMSGINKRFASQNPGKVQKITQIAETYRKPLSLQDAEEFLQDANNELHTYYAKNKVGQNAAAQDPEIAYVLREAEALRKGLYAKLAELTGKDAAVLKSKWGALTNIQNEVLKRSNVAARQNPDSLAEQLSFASGVGDLLTNAGDLKFGTMAKGVGKIATARYMKNKNTSDALISTAFSKLKKSARSRK